MTVAGGRRPIGKTTEESAVEIMWKTKTYCIFARSQRLLENYSG